MNKTLYEEIARARLISAEAKLKFVQQRVLYCSSDLKNVLDNNGEPSPEVAERLKRWFKRAKQRAKNTTKTLILSYCHENDYVI